MFAEGQIPRDGGEPASPIAGNSTGTHGLLSPPEART